MATLGEPLSRDQRLTSREWEVLLFEAFRAILLGKTRAKNSVQLVLRAQALGWLDLLSTPHAEG